jgi:hypothetical protein
MKKKGPKKLPDDHKKLNFFKLMSHLTHEQRDVLDFQDVEMIRSIMISEGYDKENLDTSIQGIANRVLIDKLNKTTDGEID